MKIKLPNQSLTVVDPLERNGKVPDQFGGVIVGIVGKHRTYSESDWN